MKRVRTIRWYGGKYEIMPWVISNLFPRKSIFVDLFGGSGGVLLNREANNPSKIPIYNDLNGDVVRLFRTLRCHGEDVKKALSMTPYSREEHALCHNLNICDDVEFARRYLVMARQSSFFREDRDFFQFKTNKQVRPGNYAVTFSNYVDQMNETIKILKRTQIECVDAIDIIERFSNVEDCILYADPPYPDESRLSGDRHYIHDTTKDLHLSLYKASSKSKSLIAISTAQNDMYDDMYSQWIKKVKKTPNRTSANRGGGTKPMYEVMYMNYNELGERIV